MLSEIKDRALKLLDESLLTPPGQEYEKKLATFIDMAQKQLALIVPIKRTKLMRAEGGILRKEDGMYKISQLRSPDGKSAYPCVRLGDGLLIPDGEYLAEYWKVPEKIDASTPDDAELEVSQQAQEAIPFFAAAMCVPGEETQLYLLFMSQYNERVMNMQNELTATARVNADV